MTLSIDAVCTLMREVAQEEILSRFRNLGEDDIYEKNKGDIVTEADIAAERALKRGLKALLPGSLVIGEEGFHADPSLMDHFDTDDYVWIIDPVDGTRNFAKGKDGFCVIVALTRHGKTEMGWIYQPTTDQMVLGERGSGSFKDGQRLQTGPATEATTRGALHLNYLPKHLRDQMKEGIATMASNEPISSAGLEYVRIASRETDVTMFWNTYPWDHAAGALIVEEAGGRAGFKNGKRYHPGVREEKGILVTGDPGLWDHWCKVLFNDEKWQQVAKGQHP